MGTHETIQPSSELLEAPVIRVKTSKLTELTQAFNDKERFALTWPKTGKRITLTEAKAPHQKQSILWDEPTSHMTGRVVLDQLASTLTAPSGIIHKPIEYQGLFYRKSSLPENIARVEHSDHSILQGIHYLYDPQQYQANRKRMPSLQRLLTRRVPMLALHHKDKGYDSSAS
ncbi:MAG: hypothetical protein ACKO37_07705, partial [Vampirovibrionales bacterium]